MGAECTFTFKMIESTLICLKHILNKQELWRKAFYLHIIFQNCTFFKIHPNPFFPLWKLYFSSFLVTQLLYTFLNLSLNLLNALVPGNSSQTAVLLFFWSILYSELILILASVHGNIWFYFRKLSVVSQFLHNI